LNRIQVATIWIYAGIKDFYFAFCNEQKHFGEYTIYFDIQGIEKFIKGFLLFHHPEIYEGFKDQDARIRIDKKVRAKHWGHNFEAMLKEVEPFVGKAIIDQILSSPFDGFTGKEFLTAIKIGYIESRYPLVPNPAYQMHPTQHAKVFKDPLQSSGLHKFAYRLCQEMFLSLKGTVDLSDLKSSVVRLLGNKNTGRRFTNLFFKQYISKYL